ncbi:hypothetical protein Heshes_24410 [Alicyclobacillus hesperidum]|uniref:Two-component signal transduction system YycFG, regulatory protein YycH n=1 Tax=Alicyclobacillus hesperidum TaxID=89784 RepID=A0A1H2X4P7_9BACL|nr:two-component system activity regulator YycH [Alicyclobacillus hesperidum]GLV14757.1 hypothetical protein Heshes_24410 [Alicyclobacillus hesperidum]SDW87757.1 Two-component signal transduction system YycFG, regulatory protein YycH [Alicyclobacillus hesperidum]
MMPSFLRTVKTAILVLLVASSMVLSFLLWSDNLQEGSEIGLAQPHSLPIAATPSLAQTIRPYEIDVETGDRHTVIRPGSAAYAFWTGQLLTARPMHPIVSTDMPNSATLRVSFQFGIPLNGAIGKSWLDGLGQELVGWQCRTIVIYAMPGWSTCSMALIGNDAGGQTQIFMEQTTLSVPSLESTAQSEAAEAPYSVWDDFEGESRVPENGHMQRIVYSYTEPEALPLIQSFFLNPQAITKIQENASTTLWTDGSRAVQIDKGADQLEYEDPNAGASGLHSEDYLTAIDFLHAHGGGPENLIGFDLLGMLTVNLNGPTLSFAQFVDGYPILDNAADYNLDIESGHVLEFDRPLWTLSTVVRQTQVSVIGQSQLISSLERLGSRVNVHTFHVELGYVPVRQSMPAGEIELEPAYYVTNNGGDVWVLDAVNGAIIAEGLA